MKFITNIIEDYMAKKRGTTKFIDTTSIKNVMRFEVTDNVR